MGSEVTGITGACVAKVKATGGAATTICTGADVSAEVGDKIAFKATRTGVATSRIGADVVGSTGAGVSGMTGAGVGATVVGDAVTNICTGAGVVAAKNVGFLVRGPVTRISIGLIVKLGDLDGDGVGSSYLLGWDVPNSNGLEMGVAGRNLTTTAGPQICSN